MEQLKDILEPGLISRMEQLLFDAEMGLSIASRAQIEDEEYEVVECQK